MSRYNSHPAATTKRLPVGQYTEAAAGVIGDSFKNNQITFNCYANDPVPALPYIGGNAGIATLRDLWTVLSGGDNTQHSCYGTGAAGCTQVEIPTQNGYQGTPDGNALLIKYQGGVRVDENNVARDVNGGAK